MPDIAVWLPSASFFLLEALCAMVASSKLDDLKRFTVFGYEPQSWYGYEPHIPPRPYKCGRVSPHSLSVTATEQTNKWWSKLKC